MTLATLGTLLRKTAGSGDPAALAPPGELLATLALEVDRPEWAFLKSERLAGGYVIEAQHALARSPCGLVNPVGSGVLTVIHEISCLSTDYVLTVSLLTAALVGGYDSDGVEFHRDTRAGLFNTAAYYPACRIISDEATVPGGVITRIYPHLYDTTYWSYHNETPYVLQPGSALVVCPINDDKHLQAAFVWVESVLSPEELQGAVRSA